MSIHIEAVRGDIAETVILPGDPLRAKYIADTFLDNVICYNRVRNMFGYTGYYNSRKISVQGSGMGLPSLSIYVNELIREYEVKSIIRAGSCGAMQPDIDLFDIILAQSASTDSAMNKIRFGGMDYAPAADFELLLKAFDVCKRMDISPKVGTILSADSFYHPIPDSWKLWAGYGTLAVEMESSALYTICAQYGVKALSVLTVSDSLVSGKETTKDEREKSFDTMAKICLECGISE